MIARVKERGESGGVLIEIALAAPLFLCGLFALMWLGFIINAKQSLSSSMFKALRLSVTRGDAYRLGLNPEQSLIPDVAIWQQSRGDPSERLKSLLSSEDVTWQDAMAHYDGAALQELQARGYMDSRSLRSLPPAYIYSLIYLYEGLRQNIGPSLRYPCDPEVFGNDGCIQCVFTASPEEEPPTQDPPPQGGLNNALYDEVPVNTIGLRCKFKPSLFLITPAMNSLALMLGHASVPQVLFAKELTIWVPG